MHWSIPAVSSTEGVGPHDQEMGIENHNYDEHDQSNRF